MARTNQPFSKRGTRPASRITRPEDKLPPVDPALAKLEGKVDKTTTVGTDATLTGGGDLSVDLELGVDLAAEEDRIVALIQSKIVQGAGCTITIVADTIVISVP